MTVTEQTKIIALDNRPYLVKASRLAVKDTGPRAEPWVPTEGLSYDPWPGPGDSEGGGWY